LISKINLNYYFISEAPISFASSRQFPAKKLQTRNGYHLSLLKFDVKPIAKIFGDGSWFVRELMTAIIAISVQSAPFWIRYLIKYCTIRVFDESKFRGYFGKRSKVEQT
jgi:hypothetical protein